VKKIGDYARTIIDINEKFGASKDSLVRDLVQLSLSKSLELIGEHADGLSDSYKKRVTRVPWRRIKVMKNNLVHDFENINLEEFWSMVDNDVPEIVAFCDEVLQKA
jgi:uncharacterized protein with HEPN domain